MNHSTILYFCFVKYITKLIWYIYILSALSSDIVHLPTQILIKNAYNIDTAKQ